MFANYSVFRQSFTFAVPHDLYCLGRVCGWVVTVGRFWNLLCGWKIANKPFLILSSIKIIFFCKLSFYNSFLSTQMFWTILSMFQVLGHSVRMIEKAGGWSAGCGRESKRASSFPLPDPARFPPAFSIIPSEGEPGTGHSSFLISVSVSREYIS